VLIYGSQPANDALNCSSEIQHVYPKRSFQAVHSQVRQGLAGGSQVYERLVRSFRNGTLCLTTVVYHVKKKQAVENNQPSHGDDELSESGEESEAGSAKERQAEEGCSIGDEEYAQPDGTQANTSALPGHEDSLYQSGSSARSSSLRASSVRHPEPSSLLLLSPQSFSSNVDLPFLQSSASSPQISAGFDHSIDKRGTCTIKGEIETSGVGHRVGSENVVGAGQVIRFIAFARSVEHEEDAEAVFNSVLLSRILPCRHRRVKASPGSLKSFSKFLSPAVFLLQLTSSSSDRSLVSQLA
jgi:hypothetical protein